MLFKNVESDNLLSERFLQEESPVDSLQEVLINHIIRYLDEAKNNTATEVMMAAKWNFISSYIAFVHQHICPWLPEVDIIAEASAIIENNQLDSNKLRNDLIQRATELSTTDSSSDSSSHMTLTPTAIMTPDYFLIDNYVDNALRFFTPTPTTPVQLSGEPTTGLIKPIPVTP